MPLKKKETCWAVYSPEIDGYFDEDGSWSSKIGENLHPDKKTAQKIIVQLNDEADWGVDIQYFPELIKVTLLPEKHGLINIKTKKIK